MSTREVVGIAVDASAVRVVCLRGSRVQWILECDRDDDSSVGAALGELLARAPSSARRAAVIAMGPALVQVRRLDGFPHTDGAATRALILSEGVRRWFLMRPGGLRASGPWEAADGTSWGAAFERSAADELHHVAEQAGFAVTQLVPSVVMLGGAPYDALAERPEGLDAALAPLGTEGARFEDALSAALLAARDVPAPLALPGARARDRAIPKSRARAAMLVAAFAALAMLIAYPATLWRIQRRLDVELSLTRSLLATEAARLGELAGSTEALDAIEHRRATRITWISLIAALGDALPTGTAAVTLRADSTAAVIVVVGPRAGAAIDRFDGIPGIVSPTLVGPVTTESLGGQLVERATIGFTLGVRPEGPR